ERVIALLEGARERVHREAARYAARPAFPHRRRHRAWLPGLRSGYRNTDARAGARGRAADEHRADPGRHGARDALALLRWRLHHRAADAGGRDRRTVRNAAAAARARAARHELVDLGAAAARRVRAPVPLPAAGVARRVRGDAPPAVRRGPQPPRAGPNPHTYE